MFISELMDILKDHIEKYGGKEVIFKCDEFDGVYLESGDNVNINNVGMDKNKNLVFGFKY